MEKKQREKLRQKIVETMRQTESDIENLVELTKPIVPDNAVGRLSRMEAIGAKSVNEAALAVARRKLGGLQYALAHLDEPEFGLCRDCGEPIPLGRIMIMPETMLCVKCAE